MNTYKKRSTIVIRAVVVKLVYGCEVCDVVAQSTKS